MGRIAQTTTSSCCTCAQLLNNVPRVASGSEKPFPDDRNLPCCQRIICGRCIHNNPRFAIYCPYCQTSTPLDSSQPQSYTSFPPPNSDSKRNSPPPPYSLPAEDYTHPLSEKQEPQAAADDILHFIDHERDTIASLSLRYGVPALILRQTNKLASDHLLAGRRTVVVPGSHYRGGVSLSPRPVEGEEEEKRKAKVRRFMVGCKVSDYDVAILYLEQAGYDLGAAVEQFQGDELWERAHPLSHRQKALKPQKSRLGRIF